MPQIEQLGARPLNQVALAAACPWPAPSGSSPQAGQQKEMAKLHDGRTSKSTLAQLYLKDFVAGALYILYVQHNMQHSDKSCGAAAWL